MSLQDYGNLIRSNDLSGSDSFAQRMRKSMGNDPRLLMLELANERQFSTTGVSATVSHVVIPCLGGIGPSIQDIVCHAYGRGLSSANFKYQVTGQKSYDGVDWIDFVTALIAQQTTGGYHISSTPHSDRSDYGLYLRFLIAVTDTGTKENGIVSAALAIRLWK